MSTQSPVDPRDPRRSFLEVLATLLPVEQIDELWIFPPRRTAVGESMVIVASGFETDPQRRRLLTAQRISRKDAKGIPQMQDIIDEQGSAPTDRVERVVEGVLRRMGDDATTPIAPVAIRGDAARWAALLEELGPAAT